MIEKNINDLYDEYKSKYNNNPKYDYSMFIVIISKYIFHRENIRPKIEWWYKLK